MITTIIRSPKGADRREINVNKIEVPDLWHVAMLLQGRGSKIAADMVLDTWHLVHDLITNIQAHNTNTRL